MPGDMVSTWVDAAGSDEDTEVPTPVVTKRYPLLLASSLGGRDRPVDEGEPGGLLVRLRRSRRH